MKKWRILFAFWIVLGGCAGIEAQTPVAVYLRLPLFCDGQPVFSGRAELQPSFKGAVLEEKPPLPSTSELKWKNDKTALVVFHFASVPAGEYQLRFVLDVVEDGHSRIGAVWSHPILMELGRKKTLYLRFNPALEVFHYPRVGESVSDFTFFALDGTTHSFAEFRGKWVLVDFWATWCGPCCKEMPNLKKVHASFARTGRFEILGLSYDEDGERLRKYVRQNGFDWFQGYIRGWKMLVGIDGRFGVDGLPDIFLVDPQGKMAARDLRGEEISKVVAAKLAE